MKAIISFDEKETMIQRCIQYSLTRFEKKHDINIIGHEKLFGNEEVETYAVQKSDKSYSLFILFKCGVQTEYWSFWMPTASQFTFLTKELPISYKIIEEFNLKHRETVE